MTRAGSGWLVLALAAMILDPATPVGAQDGPPPPEAPPMPPMQLRLQRSMLEIEDVQAQPRTIRIQDAPVPAPSVVRPGTRYVRSFGSTRLDSRSEQTLRSLAWKVDWRVELDGKFDPQFVLDAGDDRIFLQSPAWQLFDPTGKRVAEGRLGAGGVLVDPGAKLVYIPDTNGFVAALSLGDGSRAFAVLPAMGESCSRPLIARRGQDLVLAGVEMMKDPHGRAGPKGAHLQRLALGQKITTSGTGLVTSLGADETLHIDVQPMHAALSGETLVVAVHGRLLHVSTALEVKAVLEEPQLLPISMSIDEELRAYLVVDTGKGTRRALWIVTPDGVCAAAPALPADMVTGVMPPIVAHDHRVFVVSQERIVAFDPAGKPLWQRIPSGRVGGAVVTADGQLVVSEGERLMRYDREVDECLCRLEGELITTPAVPTPEGRLLVATRRRLFSLVPR